MCKPASWIGSNDHRPFVAAHSRGRRGASSRSPPRVLLRGPGGFRVSPPRAPDTPGALAARVLVALVAVGLTREKRARRFGRVRRLGLAACAPTPGAKFERTRRPASSWVRGPARELPIAARRGVREASYSVACVSV